ncbi:hypothetical protein L1987_10301 [Smallanthus sonchifolius]|uniref:Uncharacterized protein n=1 Tax=Smallanthus sonchifolius TaxID=185202 RepID=A0ACB9JRQ0_9ASTR|nr:hypothetical protein L1987_10301 [Smallanthus sonchifolius]
MSGKRASKVRSMSLLLSNSLDEMDDDDDEITQPVEKVEVNPSLSAHANARRCSENYLVIGGRDAQQNEMIVKRYMSKGDL